MDQNMIKKRLTDKNIKPSLQRLKIYNFLLENRVHPTIDYIYNNLHEEIPTLSRTTVYNTMKLFVDNGLAIELTIDKNELRYDGYTHLHGHFMCTKCGKIEDFEIDNKIKFNKLKIKQISNIQILVEGLCNNCSN